MVGIIWYDETISLFQQNKESGLDGFIESRLFHPILNRQLCKIFSLTFSLQESNWEIELGGIRFYTVGDLGLDETVSPSFYKIVDPDSVLI